MGKTMETLKQRQAWAMLKPPHPDCKPYAYLVGGADGWSLFWATPEQASGGDYWTPVGDIGWDASIPWPFGGDDVARMEDLEALGFLDSEYA